MEPVTSPLQGTVVSIDVAPGDIVRPGQPLLVLESMKMEHVIAADFGGVVATIAVAAGDTVLPGDALVFVEPGTTTTSDAGPVAAAIDLDAVRADLAEV